MQLNKFLAGAHGPLRQATAGPIQHQMICHCRRRSWVNPTIHRSGLWLRARKFVSNCEYPGSFSSGARSSFQGSWRHQQCGVQIGLERRQWAVSVLICNLQSISNSNKTGELTVDTTISSGVTSQ
ncbi:hypothetical protein C8R45DRAFT_923209 [Mycena sanguinolenta]|nr:hypothetical protein C8R45DRAFT_923209 [Mycena sanguinolenta]